MKKKWSLILFCRIGSIYSTINDIWARVHPFLGLGSPIENTSREHRNIANQQSILLEKILPLLPMLKEEIHKLNKIACSTMAQCIFEEIRLGTIKLDKDNKLENIGRFHAVLFYHDKDFTFHRFIESLGNLRSLYEEDKELDIRMHEIQSVINRMLDNGDYSDGKKILDEHKIAIENVRNNRINREKEAELFVSWMHHVHENALGSWPKYLKEQKAKVETSEEEVQRIFVKSSIKKIIFINEDLVYKIINLLYKAEKFDFIPPFYKILDMYTSKHSILNNQESS